MDRRRSLSGCTLASCRRLYLIDRPVNDVGCRTLSLAVLYSVLCASAVRPRAPFRQHLPRGGTPQTVDCSSRATPYPLVSCTGFAAGCRGCAPSIFVFPFYETAEFLLCCWVVLSGRACASPRYFLLAHFASGGRFLLRRGSLCTASTAFFRLSSVVFLRSIRLCSRWCWRNWVRRSVALFAACILPPLLTSR